MAKENKFLAIEESEIMQFRISDIYDAADTVYSDRKKQSLSIKCFKDGYSINIEINKSNFQSEFESIISDITEEEKKVLDLLEKGKKQVDIARDLGISQAKVSGIKSKYPSLLELVSKSPIDSALSFLDTKNYYIQSIEEIKNKKEQIEREIINSKIDGGETDE